LERPSFSATNHLRIIKPEQPEPNVLAEKSQAKVYHQNESSNACVFIDRFNSSNVRICSIVPIPAIPAAAASIEREN